MGEAAILMHAMGFTSRKHSEAAGMAAKRPGKREKRNETMLRGEKEKITRTRKIYAWVAPLGMPQRSPSWGRRMISSTTVLRERRQTSRKARAMSAAGMIRSSATPLPLQEGDQVAPG